VAFRTVKPQPPRARMPSVPGMARPSPAGWLAAQAHLWPRLCRCDSTLVVIHEAVHRPAKPCHPFHSRQRSPMGVGGASPFKMGSFHSEVVMLRASVPACQRGRGLRFPVLVFGGGAAAGKLVASPLCGGLRLAAGWAWGADVAALSAVLAAGVSRVVGVRGLWVGWAGAVGSASAASVVSAVAAARGFVFWQAGGYASVPIRGPACCPHPGGGGGGCWLGGVLRRPGLRLARGSPAAWWRGVFSRCWRFHWTFWAGHCASVFTHRGHSVFTSMEPGCFHLMAPPAGPWVWAAGAQGWRAVRFQILLFGPK